MIVIDIGNTETVIGLYLKKKLIKIDRIISSISINNFEKKFNKYFQLHKKLLSNNENKLCVISSVVPKLTKIILKNVKKESFKFFKVKGDSAYNKFKINYDLNQIGADRIANSVAVIESKISDSIVIDFGTATTFEVVKNRVFVGGLIFPGINLSKESLVKKASLLKDAKIIKTQKIIANNTINSIQSGFYWGYIFAINGIIKKIIKEQKFKPKIVLTGGLANIYKNQIQPKAIVKQNLTLEGLRIIGDRVNVKKIK